MIAFSRLRMLWGALDWQAGSDHPYSSAQTTSGGTSALGGAAGIGVRRVICVFDRSTQTPAADAMEMHFDFLNYTSGSPDDTWITSDYTTLEGYLDTFFSALVAYWPSTSKLTQYNWYRAGAGIVAPNPAERAFTRVTPLAGTGTSYHEPQMASTITFRTAVRRSWGRTYLPVNAVALAADQRLTSAQVDGIANAANTLISSAAGSDFQLVVTSKRLSAALAVEKVEVDNVLDVIRRRRFKASTYRKILP